MKYKYFRLINGIYYFNDLSDIKDNKRIAMEPYSTGYLDNKIMKKIEAIINNLENGKEYPDGNDVLTNDEYLKNTHKNYSTQLSKIKILKKGK